MTAQVYVMAGSAYKGAIEYLPYNFNDFQIAALNNNELRLLRNIIYAQYGYIFKDKKH